MRLIFLAVLVLAACGPQPTPTPTATIKPSGSSVGDVCHQGSVTYCALNPAVTQATIKTTICVSGWTKTVRPPVSYTDQLKAKQVHDLGLAGNLSDYEEDHRLSLDLGGAPKDPLNLSPEPLASAHVKDQDENTFKQRVCAGSLSLVAAQQAFISKWLAAYPGYRQ